MGAVNVNVPGSSVLYSFVTASSYANLPSVAAEDTIGLITSSTVNKVEFCNELPASGVSAGDVRIKTGPIADQYVNILAKPLVKLYPISAYRYNGSSWDGLEAYVRRSAAWNVLRIDLYKTGAVNAVIGSLTAYGTPSYGIAQALNADNFMIQLTSGANTGFVCYYAANAIDITNYSKLVITYSRTQSDANGTRKARMYLNPTALLGSNAGFSEGVGGVDLPISAGNTVEFDVSAKTGTQKVHVAAGKSSYYTVDSTYVTHIYAK